MFGHGVINSHHREFQHFIRSHRAQTDHAGGGLFGSTNDVRDQVAPFLVDGAHQIRAVIHGDMWGMVKRCTQVFVISLVVFALDRVNRDLVMRNQRGSHVILS